MLYLTSFSRQYATGISDMTVHLSLLMLINSLHTPERAIKMTMPTSVDVQMAAEEAGDVGDQIGPSSGFHPQDNVPQSERVQRDQKSSTATAINDARKAPPGGSPWAIGEVGYERQLQQHGGSLVYPTLPSHASMDRPLLDGGRSGGGDISPSGGGYNVFTGDIPPSAISSSTSTSGNLIPVKSERIVSPQQLPWLEAAAAHREWQQQQQFRQQREGPLGSEGSYLGAPAAPSPLYGTVSGDAELERRLQEAYREALGVGRGDPGEMPGSSTVQSYVTPRRRPLGLYLLPEDTLPASNSSKVGAETGTSHIDVKMASTESSTKVDIPLGSAGGPLDAREAFVPHQRPHFPESTEATGPGPSVGGNPPDGAVINVNASEVLQLHPPYRDKNINGQSNNRSARSSDYGDEGSSSNPPVSVAFTPAVQQIPGGFPRPSSSASHQPGVQPFGHGLGIGGGGHHRNPSRDVVRVTKNPLWNSDEWK